MAPEHIPATNIFLLTARDSALCLLPRRRILLGRNRSAALSQCSICAHKNATGLISCELGGVLRDLSLYFNNANEAEGGAKRRITHYPMSVLARSLFTLSSPKAKAVVFPDGFQGNKNASGYSQASWDALHKTYMIHKQRRINIDNDISTSIKCLLC